MVLLVRLLKIDFSTVQRKKKHGSLHSVISDMGFLSDIEDVLNYSLKHGKAVTFVRFFVLPM